MDNNSILGAAGNSLRGIMAKISETTLKALNKLPISQRKKTDEIVQRHVRACFDLGIKPENLDRVYIEAMEEAKLAARNPERYADTVQGYEPFWRFGVYVSPRTD